MNAILNTFIHKRRSAGSGYIAFDGDLNISCFTAPAGRLFGIDDEMVGAPLTRVKNFDEVVKAVSTLSPARLNTVATASSGSRVEALHICAQFNDQTMSGGIIRIQPQTTAEKDREHFESLINDEMKIGGWEQDQESRKLQWSKSIYKIYQIDEEIEPEVAITRFKTPDYSREWVRQQAEECRKGQNYSGEIEFFRPDGTPLHCIGSGRPVFDDNGNIVVIRGCLEDITQAYLERARNLMAVNIAKIGIWDFDHVKDTVSWSPIQFRMLGVEPTTEKLPNDIGLDQLAPEDRKRLVANYCKIMKTDLPYEDKYRMWTKDTGELKHIRSWTKTYRHNGKMIKTVGLNLDITADVLAEQELLRERSRSFHQAKLQSLGELAGGIGHEINNPLAIAMGAMEELEHQLRDQNVTEPRIAEITKNQRLALERVQSLTKGLKRLVEDDDTPQQAIDIKEVIEATLSLIKEMFLKHRIEIIANLQSALIIGHFGQLQQVLLNLFGNARDAMIDRPQRKLTIENYLEGEQVVIRVKDSGEGIPANRLDKIFENFFTTKKSGAGTGLGLTISRKIIRKHGGDITVRSMPQKGTTFLINIPQHLSEHIPQQNIAPAMSTNQTTIEKVDEFGCLSGKKALVVDDEPMLLKIVSRYAETFNMEVYSTVSSLQAVKEFETREFDVLITDICMPEMDGDEVIRRARNLQPSLRVLAITGGVLNRQLEESLDSPELANKVLNKPFTRAELGAALQEVVTSDKP